MNIDGFSYFFKSKFENKTEEYATNWERVKSLIKMLDYDYQNESLHWVHALEWLARVEGSGSMGLVVGYPKIGKSALLRFYIKNFRPLLYGNYPHPVYVVATPDCDSDDLLHLLLETQDVETLVQSLPSHTASPYVTKHKKYIPKSKSEKRTLFRSIFDKTDQTFVVDNAEYLTPQGLKELRVINNYGEGMPVFLVANPNVNLIIESAHMSDYFNDDNSVLDLTKVKFSEEFIATYIEWYDMTVCKDSDIR